MACWSRIPVRLGRETLSEFPAGAPREQYPISYYNELFVWNQACPGQPAHFHLIGAESNIAHRTPSVIQSDGWWYSGAADERHRPATGSVPAKPSAGTASFR